MLTILDLRNVLPINKRLTIQRREIDEIKYLVLHCTERDWTVWQTALYHTTPSVKNHIDPNGCPTIAYTYFIDNDGRVFQCLDWSVKGWHVGKWNRISLGVVLRYLCDDKPLNDIQWNVAVELFAYLVRELNLSVENIVGHRELEGTGYSINEKGEKIYRKYCPGKLIDMDLFRKDVSRYLDNNK